MRWSRSIAPFGIALSGCALFTSLDGFTSSGAAPDAGADANAFSQDAPSSEDGGQSTNAALDAATSCDADIKSDPKHCGACGHDCLGGACASGACTAFVVVTAAGTEANQSLALRDGKLYWTHWGDSVMSATIGGAPQLLASGIDSPTGLVVRNDGALVVVSYNSGILGTADGIDAGLKTIASGLGNPGCIAMDSAGVVYIPDYTGGRILRVAGSVVTPIVTDQDAPWGVATRDGIVYWTTATQVRRANSDGSAETILVGGESNLGCLAVDDKYLYWPLYLKTGLRRALRTGGTAATIAPGTPGFGVALDDVSVFYADDGKILRLAK
jgi:hypothetical protein